MKRSKIFLALLLPLLGIGLSACNTEEPKPQDLPQYGIIVNIGHSWAEQDLEINGPYYITEDGDSFQLTKLIYHVNNFKFYNSNGDVLQDKGDYFMVDLEDGMDHTFSFGTVEGDIDSVSFTIGVSDSAVNANGDLATLFTDPMYWGMINGYINFKLEGVSPSVGNNAVVLHVGGYLEPYMNSKDIGFTFNTPVKTDLGSNEIDMELDLSKYFYGPNTIHLDSTHMIHSPNDASRMIVENWGDMVSLQ